MTTLMKHLLQGLQPTPAEWEAFLVEAHCAAPSMSPEAFAACKNAQQINSYEWLAGDVAHLKSPQLVVDLACGDGYLVPYLEKRLAPECGVVGIDMSEAGLVAARKRSYTRPVEFRLARAQETGLGASTVDGIFCHMGLMLMNPIAPVVQELTRVLKPGGILSAVVANRGHRSGPLKEILGVVEEMLHHEYPQMAAPKLGDDRTESAAGVEALFSGVAELVSCDDDTFGLETDAEAAWDQVKNMYLIAGLPQDFRERVRQRAVEQLRQASSTPRRFEFAFRKFVLRKF